MAILLIKVRISYGGLSSQPGPVEKIEFEVIAELQRPEGPPSRAP